MCQIKPTVFRHFFQAHVKSSSLYRIVKWMIANVHYDLELCHSARMRTSRLPAARQRKAFNDDDSTTTGSLIVFQSAQHRRYKTKSFSFGSSSSVWTMKPTQMTLAGRPACGSVGHSFASAAATAAQHHQQQRRLLQTCIASSRINDRQTVYPAAAYAPSSLHSVPYSCLPRQAVAL